MVDKMRVGIGAHERDNDFDNHHSPTYRKMIRKAYLGFPLWLVVLLGLLVPSQAAFLPNFTNCMAPSIQTSIPRQLQWVPQAVSVVFNASAGYNLNITVYGNVTGQRDAEPLPAWNDPIWNNPNFTNGKIIDGDPASAVNGKFLEATLESQFSVLSYIPYASTLRFCGTTNRPCPIGPVFNSTGINDLPTFSVANNMESSYGFSSIHAYLHFKDHRTPPYPLGCIIADITPYIGSAVSALLTYIPLAILILVAIATTAAAIFSPWGTWNIFKCTTNYGRDADLLRLVTPGFGDCLQYIQFIFLSGSLTLDYPGFYQPATSSVAWSSLVFNSSFVSQNTTINTAGPTGLIDGIYVTNATRGLESMSQIIGMANDRNIWTGMIIWLLIIVVAIVAIIQISFVARWIYHRVSNTREEDLRAKNLPFSIGNIIRIVFNYFLLPVVAFSMYELVVAHLVIAEGSSVVPVAFAVVTLLLLVGFIIWVGRVIIRANPRSQLFDDYPTVLTYGPLYNTYSDNAAAFALVPLILIFIRGIAIGAVQASGVAQLVILILCEIILILTLNAWRPFSSPTSMNVYHTIFSAVRLVILLLMITFVPALGVDDAPRGWIAYAILLLHGLVLVIGFFLHSLQTLVEVGARMLGAGDDRGTATRGGLVKVFGVRQLSRRRAPRDGRGSMASNAAMLNATSEVGRESAARSRSLSASSNLLLSRNGTSNRQSIALESALGGASSTGPYTPLNGPPATPYSVLPSPGNQPGSRTSGIVNIRAAEPADPWFRQPRPRKNTVELQSPNTTHSHGSMSSGDWQKITADEPESPDVLDSRDGWITPLPAHLGNTRERAGSVPDDGRPKPDYATREVDYYYGVRGPALSHAPTRRLKTGPADPTGPVSSATGWFKGFFGGKTKEKGKGFEVVRSSRMPPPQSQEGGIALEEQGPYLDDPEGVAVTPTKRRTLALEDEGDAVGGGTRKLPEARVSPETSIDDATDGEDDGNIRITPAPPVLDLDTGDAFTLPSRFTSKASNNRPTRIDTKRSTSNTPNLPRKSSKRADSDGPPMDIHRLSTIPQSPAIASKHNSLAPDTSVSRMPFGVGGGNDDHRRTISTRTGDSKQSSVLTGSSHDWTANDRNPEAAIGRPSSVGFVSQHRAGDGMHVIAPEDYDHGAAAEVVDASPSKPAAQYPNF